MTHVVLSRSELEGCLDEQGLATLLRAKGLSLAPLTGHLEPPYRVWELPEGGWEVFQGADACSCGPGGAAAPHHPSCALWRHTAQEAHPAGLWRRLYNAIG